MDAKNNQIVELIDGDQGFDFDEDDIEEGVAQPQIKDNSLLVNPPRQMLAKEGQPYVKRFVQNNQNGVKIIEKIVPVFKQDNTLKIEREVQTQQSVNDSEVLFVQNLMNNQQFKELSQNFQEYEKMMKCYEEIYGNNQNLKEKFIKMEQLLQSRNQQNFENNINQLSPYDSIPQQQIRPLRNQFLSSVNHNFYDQDEFQAQNQDLNNQVSDQNNLNQTPKLKPRSQKKPKTSKKEAEKIQKQEAQLQRSQHNLNVESVNFTQHSCKQCLKYQEIIIMLFKQIQKLLKVNETMDFYQQNSISSSQIILNLIEDLLTLAKIQKNVFEINMEENVNLIEIVQEAYQVLSFSAESKEIKLCLQIDKSQPFVLQRVYTDKRRILQIFLNFLSNSIKFTNNGGEIKIKFSILEDQVIDDIEIEENNTFKEISKFIKLKIQIEDNGMGIKKENMDKLFTDFQKLNEHKSINTKGTGLGLSVCKQIIELMGGKVSVSSLFGVGTKINILLQLKTLDRLYRYPDTIQLQTQLDKINYLKSQNAFRYSENFENHFQIQDNFESLQIPSHENSDKYTQRIDDNDFIILESQKENYKYTSISKQENTKDQNGPSYHQQIQKMIGKIEDFKIKNESLMDQQSLINSAYSCNNEVSKLNSNQLRQDLQNISMINGQKLMPYISELDQEFNLDQNKKYFQKSQQIIQEKNLQLQINEDDKSSDSSQDQNQIKKKQNQIFALNANKQYQLQNQNEFVSFQDVKIKLNKNINNFPSFQASILDSKDENKEEYQQQIDQIYSKIHEIQQQKLNKDSLKSDADKKTIKSAQTLKQERYLKESIKFLKNYEKKKLRILVANDETYSLFVVQTTLEQFNFVKKVDAVQNGQMALDLVLNNEKQDHANNTDANKHFYDVIFLDLQMPIMNGYDACKAIKAHYKQVDQQIRSGNFFKQSNVESQVQSEFNLGSHVVDLFRNQTSQPVPDWIIDLKSIYDKYQDLRENNKKQPLKNSSSKESEKLSEIEIQILKIFNTLYTNQRYQLLQYTNRPFIFAYSAMVNSQVQEQTKSGGFDQCIDAPLNKIKIEKAFSDYLNIFVFKITVKMMEKLGNVTNFIDMIDEPRIKRIFLQSSSEYNKSLGSYIYSNSNPSRELNQQIINEIDSSNEIEGSRLSINKSINNKETEQKDQKLQPGILQIMNANLSNIIEEKDDWSFSNQSKLLLNKISIKISDEDFEFEDNNILSQKNYSPNNQELRNLSHHYFRSENNFNQQSNNIINKSIEKQ